MKRSLLACLTAFKMLIIFYIGGIVVFPYFAWTLLAIGVITLTWQLALLMGAIALLCLIAGLFWLAALNLLYSAFLRLLWSKPPAWTCLINKRNLLGNYCIGSISCIPISLILTAAIGVKTAAEVQWGIELEWQRESPIAVEILLRCWWIWFTVAVGMIRAIPSPRQSTKP
jgi:hypothetical protein